METIQIISEAMTLADVTVKRAYFLEGGSKMREAERKSGSKRQSEIEKSKKRETECQRKSWFSPQISVRLLFDTNNVFKTFGNIQFRISKPRAR